jgi:sRNA-binding protein
LVFQQIKNTIRKALWKYCNHRKYLRALIAETQRIDLTGQPVAEITADEKSHAEWRIGKAVKRDKEALRAKKLPRKNFER